VQSAGVWSKLIGVLVVAAALGVAGPASASSSHRSWCHSSHTCPSDHHTYAWNGLYCTSYADERLVTDTRTVFYKAMRFWCGHKASGTLMSARRSGSGSAKKCDPSYVGACLKPNVSDYDCAGGSGDGPYYTGPVRVVGPDHYGLDRDGDGYACEG
jgi:hypothetical protein